MHFANNISSWFNMLIQMEMDNNSNKMMKTTSVSIIYHWVAHIWGASPVLVSCTSDTACPLTYSSPRHPLHVSDPTENWTHTHTQPHTHTTTHTHTHTHTHSTHSTRIWKILFNTGNSVQSNNKQRRAVQCPLHGPLVYDHNMVNRSATVWHVQ